MRPFHAIGPLLFFTMASAAPGGGVEKDLPPDLTDSPGKIGVMMATPVSEGTFAGTWMYVNRDLHMAMWIKTEEGRPRIRIQYQSIVNPESFETDWSGKSNYYLSGHPVTFDFALLNSDADRITGKWFWDYQTDFSGRTEKSDIVLQRTGFGRTMVMAFNNFEKTIRRTGNAKTFRLPMAWNWTKVSKRELLWSEMPW